METKEYRTEDRSRWPAGPWDSEPDKMQWPDTETGLPCLAVRNWVGAWCGYVGVAAGHPFFGVEYNDGPANMDVHGGLTFAAFCADTADESKHICHVPGPGEPHRVWWLGFDCSHLGDYGPEDARRADDPVLGYRVREGSYKTLAYVREQCAELAKQLSACSTLTP